MSTAPSSNRRDRSEMTRRTIEPAQQTAARVAGFAYLISFATVVFAQFRIHDRLIVAGNPAETARNIIAHERLFRISIACALIYCLAVVVLLSALHDSQASKSRPCLACGIREARICLDVGSDDAQPFGRSAALERR